jgi:hypothetical protein
MGASLRATQSASTQPAPPPDAMPKALKPAPTNMLAHSGAWPRMKLPSGVKLSGPLIICLMPTLASAGTRAEGRFHVLFKVLEVIFEQLELEGGGHVALGPGNRVRLIAAKDEAAHFLLEIGEQVGVTDGGGCRRRGRGFSPS